MPHHAPERTGALAPEVSILSKSANRRIGTALIFAVAIFVWWYVEAEDFSDSRVAGKYVFIHDGVTQQLTLKRDHTFEQEDSVSGTTTHASGTWRVFTSTGHMAFSRSFIDARDEWRGLDDHKVFGIVKNYLGLVSITFDPYSKPVMAFKKLFS
ncbi:MAG: hypothetical protein M3O31_08580 [Acidobacteriota bacterium]|nr:hypothetical protein [Acidobacteriota bacterium]